MAEVILPSFEILLSSFKVTAEPLLITTRSMSFQVKLNLNLLSFLFFLFFCPAPRKNYTTQLYIACFTHLFYNLLHLLCLSQNSIRVQ